MRAIQLTLGDYLAANGLTPALLLEATREQVTARALDNLTGGHTQRLDLGTLGVVITALEELTGKPVSPSDLLEVTTLPPSDSLPTDSLEDLEARQWLDSDLSRLGEFEPYDFGGHDPMTLGQPVHIGPDGGVNLK